MERPGCAASKHEQEKRGEAEGDAVHGLVTKAARRLAVGTSELEGVQAEEHLVAIGPQYQRQYCADDDHEEVEYLGKLAGRRSLAGARPATAAETRDARTACALSRAARRTGHEAHGSTRSVLDKSNQISRAQRLAVLSIKLEAEHAHQCKLRAAPPSAFICGAGPGSYLHAGGQRACPADSRVGGEDPTSLERKTVGSV